jgi:hypothetical protein
LPYPVEVAGLHAGVQCLSKAVERPLGLGVTQHFTRCNPGSISRTVALSLGAVKARTSRLLSLRPSRGRGVDELEPEFLVTN